MGRRLIARGGSLYPLHWHSNQTLGEGAVGGPLDNSRPRVTWEKPGVIIYSTAGSYTTAAGSRLAPRPDTLCLSVWGIILIVWARGHLFPNWAPHWGVKPLPPLNNSSAEGQSHVPRLPVLTPPPPVPGGGEGWGHPGGGV